MGKLFISYRRKDSDFAHRLAEKLETRLDAVVFIDRKIAKDDFVEALEDEVHSCNVFLLLVTENTFDESRIHDENDWIRREIALALSLKKPIALALREYKTPPSLDKIPENIAAVVTKQGVPIYLAFFDDGADAIAQHCVNISEGALKLKSKETSAATALPLSQTVVGDKNIQQIVQGATNSTIVGQQINSDNRRRDTLAKLETLRKDREEVVRYLNQLNYSPKSSTTAEGRVFQLIAVLVVVVIGFVIHPVAGIGAIGLVGVFFVMRLSASKQSDSTRQEQIRENSRHRNSK